MLKKTHMKNIHLNVYQHPEKVAEAEETQVKSNLKCTPTPDCHFVLFRTRQYSVVYR